MYNFSLFNCNTNKTIETFSFETKKEANRELRKVIKTNDLQRHAGHIVNYSTGLEINKQY